MKVEIEKHTELKALKNTGLGNSVCVFMHVCVCILLWGEKTVDEEGGD